MIFRVRDPVDRHLTCALTQEANASRSGELQTTGRAARSLGAMALGAVAIGALAIGAVAIGRLVIGRARIRRLEIDRLIVRQLRVTEAIQALPNDDAES